MPKTDTASNTSFDRKLRRFANARRTSIAASQVSKITNMVDIARAFGGIDALAEFMGSENSISRVADYLVTGDVPNGWHMRLYWELTKRGYVVDPVALEWVSARRVSKASRKKSH